MSEGRTARPLEHDREGRRSFLASLAMTFGLVAGYGALAVIAGRFLYRAGSGVRSWMFVAPVDQFEVGSSRTYRTPAGAPVVISRQAQSGQPSDFIALSSVCPHLGCQVHWEAHNDRFFCPCHNGVFDQAGTPLTGPPAQADQSLPRFDLKIEKGLLYILVSQTQFARNDHLETPRTIQSTESVRQRI